MSHTYKLIPLLLLSFAISKMSAQETIPEVEAARPAWD